MKKRTQILLLTLVLCFTSVCFLSGTVAKYVTGDKADDNAQIAKWGVTVGVDGALFGENYVANSVDSTDRKDKPTNVNEQLEPPYISVQSQSNGNLIAPGTKGDTMILSITGKPEVDVNVHFSAVAKNVFLNAGTYAIMDTITVADASDFNLKKTAKGALYTKDASGVYTEASTYADATTYYFMRNSITIDAKYYPLSFKSNVGTATNATDVTYDSLNTAIEEYAILINNGDALVSAEKTDKIYVDGTTTYNDVVGFYNSGSDLTARFDNKTLTWSWAIGDDWNANDHSAILASQTNLSDTVLGDMIAGENMVLIEQVANPDYDDQDPNSPQTIEQITQLESIGDTGLLKKSTAKTDRDAPIACLKAFLWVEITVEQVD